MRGMVLYRPVVPSVEHRQVPGYWRTRGATSSFTLLASGVGRIRWGSGAQIVLAAFTLGAVGADPFRSHVHIWLHCASVRLSRIIWTAATSRRSGAVRLAAARTVVDARRAEAGRQEGDYPPFER